MPKQMPPRTGFQPSSLFQGWGYSTYQHPTENSKSRFSAQNISSGKYDKIEEAKEDFERAVPINTEYEFTQRWNKSPSLYSMSNFGDTEKTHNLSMHNSFMLEDNHMGTEYVMTDSKAVFERQNKMSLAKPTKTPLEQSLSITDVYIKPVVFKMKAMDRDDWSATLTVKIQHRVDANSHHSHLHIELTEESNPEFLHTCKIGETEFHQIRQEQKVRVEFHKFAEYLSELFDLWIESFNRSKTSSFHTCILSTDRSNVGTLIIEESTHFKDITQLTLKFISSSVDDKLKFLSKQVKELKLISQEYYNQLKNKEAEVAHITEKWKELGKLIIPQITSKSSKNPVHTPKINFQIFKFCLKRLFQTT